MLTAFTYSLFAITAAELLDKTFFISLCLAMRYPRRWVFLGSMAALALMTVLSVLLGQAVALLPKQWTQIGSVLLFFGFGIKLLWDAARMPPSQGVCSTEQEALEQVDGTFGDPQALRRRIGQILLKTFVMTFVAEWGDRTQFSTILLATQQDPVGVTLGGIAGHGVCAAIAVFSGKAIAGRLSERIITAMGGGLFLLFALITAVELVQAR
jgi:Ca2+/H+ antiporter, TMEM165/GDT1 family